MPNPIILKNRTADTTAPTAGQLAQGELALTLAAAGPAVYTKLADNSVKRLDTLVGGLVFEFGNGVDALVANLIAGPLFVPYGLVLDRWNLVADVSGSASIAIQTSSNGTTWASIVDSTPPALSSQQVASSTALTGWTTTIAADTYVRAVLSSVATCKKLGLTVRGRR